MENNSVPSHNELAKGFIRSIVPATPVFSEFVMPFLSHPTLRKEFEKYPIILKKVGIENVEVAIGMLNNIADTYWENSDSFIGAVIKKIQDKYSTINTQRPPNEILEELMQEFSPESVIAMASEMTNKAFNKFSEELESIDRRVDELSKDERDIYDYFSLLLIKLWIYHIIMSPQITVGIVKLFLRDYLLEYHKGMQNLYAKELFPKELIIYIEGIKIPDENELLKEIVATEDRYLPNNSIPIFTHIDEVFLVLKNYFDPVQHENLKALLQSKTSPQRLVFRGQGNQLADAFKKMKKSNIITGCSKDELISWIILNFQYKGREGKYIDFNDDYLNNIISSEQKPCKNPILEIKKNEDGEVKVFSPDGVDKNFQK